MTQIVYGKNVVTQLLKGEETIHELLLMKGWKDQQIVRMANQRQIPIRWLTRAQLDAKVKDPHHQGIAARIDAVRTYSIEELLAAVPKDRHGLFVMLDELEDPHNLGAILRSCDAVGVDGVIIGKHRSVSLTPTVPLNEIDSASAPCISIRQALVAASTLKKRPFMFKTVLSKMMSRGIRRISVHRWGSGGLPCGQAPSRI